MKTKSIILIVPAVLLTVNAYAAKQVLAPLPKNFPQTPSNIYEPIPDLAEFILPANTQAAEIRQGARFFSLALQAWNPSLNPNDVERIINRHIENQGLMKGLIEPALALIDTSYAAGKPEFGNMMNPMLKRLAAPLAEGLHRQYGLPLEFTGRNFESVMKLNDRDILSSMQKMLGDEFKRNQPQPLAINDNSDFMAQAILGKSSFLGFASRNLYPNQMRNGDEGAAEPQGFQPKKDFRSTPQQMRNNEETPKKGFTGKQDWTSTPRSSNEDREERPKGLFSKLDLVSMSGQCIARCIDSTFTIAASGAGIGFVLGQQIGAVAGVIIGTIGGGYVCSQSNECKGTEPKKQEPPKNEPKPAETPKDNPPKTTEPNEPPVPKENNDTDPAPKTSDSGTPAAPKEPDTNDDDSDDNLDGESENEIKVFTNFLEDRKAPGFNLEQKKKDFKNISTPMKGT
ncbi:hypothetical protein [Bdellovibrio svalbardensis]|uniref:Glycine zipper domain-containing protein n=1 Tax=Bdellovibrio svalbardensis TaxID=2972972 RepID=A0ABT6DII8_9BACT|nr:hypothetical protein [Bdellovibrio svalbardensis]MDG0815671.1 hypothetical protein [Bdellovibrio svalbardensis]